MSLPQKVDVAIIGGGAAGLMAAISCARSNPQLSIAILDGAKKLGAKILVAGGGRCNVTHHEVKAQDFAGTSPNSIRKVLLRFDVDQTISFFGELGVRLKRESTGKLFPVSDSARDVLNALINEAIKLSVGIYCRHRVEAIEDSAHLMCISGEWGRLQAKKVILSSGGKSLPKSGSDGQGYEFCQTLGHSLTADIFPALVPLLLPEDHFICQISGVSVTARLSVENENGKVMHSFTDSVLCTHFGLSGPAVLDVSRYWRKCSLSNPGSRLTINWLAGMKAEDLEAQIISPAQRRSVRNVLAEYLPHRLVDALCDYCGIESSQKSSQLSRSHRKILLTAVFQMNLPIQGDRGFRYAEVTAGGVPLSELNLKTMQSRYCPQLYICGEVCDVDGRIGGFNFQWAWASGYVCGSSVAQALSV